MIIERYIASFSKNIFTNKPILDVLNNEIKNGIWVSPYATNRKQSTFTNNENRKYDVDYHTNAVLFLNMFNDRSVDGVFLYDTDDNNNDIHTVRKEIERILKQGGKVITISHNSYGVGYEKGFDIEKIIILTNEYERNDIICVVETKITSELF